MTVGFRVRDRSTGEVTVEITDRLTRLAGVYRVTSAPGSITVPGNGELFFYLTSDADKSAIPPITKNGRTLSWPALTSNFPHPNQVDFTIAYGEY